MPQGFNPELGEAPDAPTGREVGTVKRLFTMEKKAFIREALKVNINKVDGPNSTTLFDNLQLTTDQRTGKINGARYKGVKIFVLKEGKFTYSKDKKYTKTIDDFRTTLTLAQTEHARTNRGFAERLTVNEGIENPSPEHVDAVILNATEEVSDRLSEVEIELRNLENNFTPNENRELFGVVFDVDKNLPLDQKLKGLEKDGEYWSKRLEDATAAFNDLPEDVKRQESGDYYKLRDRVRTFKKAVRAVKLAKDCELLREKNRPLLSRLRERFRKKTDGENAIKQEQPRLDEGDPVNLGVLELSDETKNIITNEAKNGDLSKFEIFKKWSKKNLLGLSAVAVSAAGIITTMVIAARGAVKAGARATKKFAKGLAKVAEKVAPILGAVLNIVGKVLTLGAKGLDWLSRNLWLLALLIVYLIYNELSKKRRK